MLWYNTLKRLSDPLSLNDAVVFDIPRGSDFVSRLDSVSSRRGWKFGNDS
jgi:hypothetical protein